MTLESQKIIKNKTEQINIDLDKAFVDEDKRVLDPSLLDKSILERMPQPTGWRLLVLPYRGKGVSEGGIQLVKETIDRETLATVVAYVVAVGPDAYADKKRFSSVWCKKGDWIMIGRYAGSRFRLADESEVRIINDDEVIATILNPDDIVSV
jgi:co-chaperonin GroES (HSP10)